MTSTVRRDGEHAVAGDREGAAPDEHLQHARDLDAVNRDAERCRREIAEIERLLLAGHPDVEGLCMSLSDWSAELRLIEQENQLNKAKPPPDG